MVVRVKCENEWNAVSVFLLSRLWCCLSINLLGTVVARLHSMEFLTCDGSEEVCSVCEFVGLKYILVHKPLPLIEIFMSKKAKEVSEISYLFHTKNSIPFSVFQTSSFR